MSEEKKENMKQLINVLVILIALAGGSYTLYDVVANNELHQTKEIRTVSGIGAAPLQFDSAGLVIVEVEERNETLEREVSEHNNRSYKHIATKDYPIYLAILGLLIVLTSIKNQI